MKNTLITIIFSGIAGLVAWMPAEAEALKIKLEPSLIFSHFRTKTYPERVSIRRAYPVPIRAIRPPLEPIAYEAYSYYNPATGCVEYFYEPIYPAVAVPPPVPPPVSHVEGQGIDLKLKFK